MKGGGLRALKLSTMLMIAASLTLLILRLMGYSLFEESFEILCVHVPALTSAALYISARIGWLKIEDLGET